MVIAYRGDGRAGSLDLPPLPIILLAFRSSLPAVIVFLRTAAKLTLGVVTNCAEVLAVVNEPADASVVVSLGPRSSPQRGQVVGGFST